MSTKYDTCCYNIIYNPRKGVSMNHIFANRLTELRSKAGLSQKQLALTLNVAASTFSNYENGIYLPPLAKVCTLAKELDCSLDFLCGLTKVNVPAHHWERTLTTHLTFYKLVKLLLTLDAKELTELMQYADYLKYRRTHSNYIQTPQIQLVAEETT